MSYASELEVANQKLCQTNETLQEVQKELTMLATFDSLTGLYNRNKINEHLQNEITLAQRYKESFGIMLLDIDDFKMVNDTYGHLVGDEVLKEFAKLLKQHIRQTDILGRWGGEEFIILVRRVDLEDTRELAEKLRQIIEQYNFPTVMHLTSSFGISVYQEEDTIKTLFEKIDKALYLAKKADKNRVEAII
jgi:diguanylate cyclase (GGDEF)-like protein